MNKLDIALFNEDVLGTLSTKVNPGEDCKKFLNVP